MFVKGLFAIFIHIKMLSHLSAPPGVRTLDTLIKSQVLCQLS